MITVTPWGRSRRVSHETYRTPRRECLMDLSCERFTFSSIMLAVSGNAHIFSNLLFFLSFFPFFIATVVRQLRRARVDKVHKRASARGDLACRG